MNALLALLIFAVSYALLGLITFVLFAAIMKLRDRLPYLPPLAQHIGKLILAVGYVADFTFNVLSSVPFLEFPPREWLFTSRVQRHLKPPAQYRLGILNILPNLLAPWRLSVAVWFRDTWLDCIDPGHCEA